VLVLASISESLVNETSHLVRDGGLPVIFVLMAIASACIPVPSEVVMLFAGFAVADPGQSASHHHLTLIGVVLTGLLGTMVGSWVAYAVGRGGRLELFERYSGKIKWIAPPPPPRSTGPIAGFSAMASQRSCSGA